MAGEYELTRDQDIDLGGIFAAVWRNKFRLLIVSLIATVLAFFVLSVISPHYRSETKILIRASDPVLTSPDTQRPRSQSDFDDPGVADQIQLLQSRSIASRVIAELKLTEKPEFDSALNRSVLSHFLSIIRLTDDGRGVTAADRTLETYYDKLKIFQADRARVIVVQFSSKDPELAAAVPNLIAREYLAMQEEMKRGAAPDELEKLEPELKLLRESVMKAEAAVEEFRSSSDLLQGRDNDTLATQELSELSTELSRVRSQLSRAEANADAVSRALRSGSLDSAASVLQSTLIQRLRERQVTLQSQLAELSTTLLSGHPRIQALESQLETLTRQINEEARKIQASLQDEADVARAREEDLVQRRNQLKSESGRVGRAQVELRSLEREADAQRQLLNGYLVRFKEAKSRQNRDFVPADAFVFAEAQVESKPYFPKRVPILAGVFFGTFLLGSVLTMASSLLRGGQVNRIADAYQYRGSSESDLTDNGGHVEHGSASGTQAPPIVPSLKSLTQPIPTDSVVPTALAARSLSMLGTARIAVVAPEGEVTSIGSVVLARILASKGRSVIVLDMTGQGTTTQLMLGELPAAGIRDLLSGSVAFSQAIHNDRDSKVHVMPAGGNHAQLAAGSAERLPTIIDALDATYDYLIIDCGAADIGGLKRVCDAETVMIVDAADPASSAIGLISSMLKKAGFAAPLLTHAGEEERNYVGLTNA